MPSSTSNKKVVISDTTAITHLSAIGSLSLLKSLYNVIYIPQAVYDELTAQGNDIPGAISVQQSSWIKTEKVRIYRKLLNPFGKN